MRLRGLSRKDGISMSVAKFVVLGLLILCLPGWSRAAPSPAAVKAAAETLKRDSAGCSVHADIDACYDALRWNPGDPGLLIALGDILLIARGRGVETRNYNTTAEFQPT